MKTRKSVLLIIVAAFMILTVSCDAEMEEADIIRKGIRQWEEEISGVLDLSAIPERRDLNREVLFDYVEDITYYQHFVSVFPSDDKDYDEKYVYAIGANYNGLEEYHKAAGDSTLYKVTKLPEGAESRDNYLKDWKWDPEKIIKNYDIISAIYTSGESSWQVSMDRRATVRGDSSEVKIHFLEGHEFSFEYQIIDGEIRDFMVNGGANTYDIFEKYRDEVRPIIDVIDKYVKDLESHEILLNPKEAKPVPATVG